MPVQMSANARKSIEGREDQRSSLRVQLSCDSSSSGSGNFLRTTQLKNNTCSDRLSINEESSVLICCAVQPTFRTTRASSWISTTTKDGSKTISQNINKRSEIVQQGQAKDVVKSMRKRGTQKRDKSMKIVDNVDMESQLISESDKFVSCRNSGSNTPKNAGCNESNSLSLSDPIMCSTFIEGKDNCVTKTKSNCVEHTGHSKKSNSIGKAILNNKIITKINNELLEKKQQLQNNSCNESAGYIKSTTLNASIPMDLTAIQQIEQSKNKYGSKISPHKNISIRDCSVQLIRFTEDNMKTIRSSLKVNTSLDAIDKDNDTESLKERSMSIKDTSMQVNTSLDNIRQTLHENNTSKRIASFGQYVQDNENVTNSYPCPTKENSRLADINIMERFKNISAKKQSDINSRQTASPESAQCNPQRLSTDAERWSESNSSFVQGTPCPISRSVLLKSYLKVNTIMSDLNSGMSIRLFDSATRNETKIMSKPDVPNLAVDQTVIVPKDTSGPQMAVSNKHTKQARSDVALGDDTLITEEQSTASDKSADNNDLSKKINNVVDTPNAIGPIKGKKKLLPLEEDSQMYSFSPVESRPPSPKISRPLKKHQKQKKKWTRQILSPNVTNKGTSAKDDYDKTVLGTQCVDRKEDRNHIQSQKNEPRKRRKVLSKKIVVKKRPTEYLLHKLDQDGCTQESEIDLSRRVSSLDEFQSLKTIPVYRHKCRLQDIFIVTTGLSRGDKDLVKRTVKALGGAKIELRVTHRTTHIVSGGGRTINLLHGLIRGCWLVKLEWIVQSSESNRWLNPIKYEMKEFSKAVSENREDRQMFGPSYVSDLFTTCGLVHIESDATPSFEILGDLINSAGGRITDDSQKAKIIIGKSGLKESWIFDSITTGELQSVTNYQRK